MSATPPPASRPQRFFAWFLDGVVVGAPSAWLASLTSAWVGYLLGAAYVIGMTAYDGRTLGKRWLKLRVLDERSWSLPHLGAAVMRSLPFLVPPVPGGIYAAGALSLLYLPILWRTDRRGWHDLLAGTMVIDERADRYVPPT